ncbi:hypothetical protein [Pseudoduganella violaceinigra]|uniref:hypothetical protein n=1 Tax=Pseudoduganella violaceinigra TaxID=246602 RepID=UPI0003FE67EA|nr:hypothetical protein [Pseudoduganella violaceinigra]
MNTTTIIGMLLTLPFGYGALFQARPKEWVFEHASIAMLEIAGFALGLICVLVGVLV